MTKSGHTQDGMPAAEARRQRTTVGRVFLALLALLALTMSVTTVDLGWMNVAVNLGIAAAKTVLILWYFMHLREEGPFLRFFAVAAAFWLGLLFALGLSDWMTRGA